MADAWLVSGGFPPMPVSNALKNTAESNVTPPIGVEIVMSMTTLYRAAVLGGIGEGGGGGGNEGGGDGSVAHTSATKRPSGRMYLYGYRPTPAAEVSKLSYSYCIKSSGCVTSAPGGQASGLDSTIKRFPLYVANVMSAVIPLAFCTTTAPATGASMYG